MIGQRRDGHQARDVDAIRAVAFDLDGTVYLEDQLIPEASRAVAAVRHAGLDVLFVTNGSGRTDAEIAERLSDIGVPARTADVFTSASATADWLARNGPRRVAMMGAPGLRAELERAGLLVVADDEADALVVGLDRDRDWRDESPVAPALAARVAGGEVFLVACNRELVYPGRGGAPRPGCGALVLLVERQCGHRTDIVIGKPEPHLLEMAATRFGIEAQQILMVGDSWASDAVMARRCGSPWVLVPGLGIEEPPKEAYDDSSGRVLNSIAELPGVLQSLPHEGRRR